MNWGNGFIWIPMGTNGWRLWNDMSTEELIFCALTFIGGRISKPGLRVYAGSADVPKVFGGLGTAIISTNHGVITDKEARKLGVGGEVLCYVW